MSISTHPRENHLLAALPDNDLACLLPFLELVPLLAGTVLYEPGEPMRYLYFPTNAIVSLLYVLDSGASAEIAVVGHEGVVGIAIFMGGGSTPSRAVVQSAGRALRMRAMGKPSGAVATREFVLIGASCSDKNTLALKHTPCQ